MTQYEEGRSLVEILGVLAVMGILSVGGVNMYTSAMNKHRANELLNEVSKRATVAAMQFVCGRSTASLLEFTNNNLGYASFASETAEGDNENQFKVVLETAPSADICAQMKAFIGSNSSIRKINTDCTEISFNKDLSINAYPSDYDGNQEKCEENEDKYLSNDYSNSGDITWELPTTLKISSVKVYTTTETNQLGRFPQSIKIETSLDGVWEEVIDETLTTYPASGDFVELTLTSPVKANKIKWIFGPPLANSWGGIAVAEIRITAQEVQQATYTFDDSSGQCVIAGE